MVYHVKMLKMDPGYLVEISRPDLWTPWHGTLDLWLRLLAVLLSDNNRRQVVHILSSITVTE